MKRLLLLLPVISMGFSVADTSLTREERDFAIGYMKETREKLLKDVQGLSETQLNFKSAPEKWSIFQCLEHIAIAESAFMRAIQETLKQPSDPSRRTGIKASDSDVLKTVTDRSHKSTAPEFLQPGTKFRNSAEAIKAFLMQRQKNIDYIQSTEDDLRNHFLPHALLGLLDDYQYLLVISAHCRRHTLQIEEVKADANFPPN